MRLLVTREEYFAAALNLLASKDSGKLRIASLCGALKVTSGSFYGYFGSFDGFVEQFLSYWEQTQTERVAQLSKVPDDPAESVRLLKQLGAQLPHAAEAAIRGWAHTNPTVAAAQQRVDERRQETLRNIVEPIAGSRAEADKLAVLGMTLLVGLQQWRSPVKAEDYDVVFRELEDAVFRRAQNFASS